MKILFYIFILILLGSSVLVAQSNFNNVHYLDPYNPEYVKGEVLIKFKDEAQVNKSIKSGVAKTGLSSVDKVLEPYQTEAIVKVFKETREQRQRKTNKTIHDFKGNEIEVPALFNIYKLKFDTIWDVKQLVEELKKDTTVDFAEPNYLVYTMEILESRILPKHSSLPNPNITPQNSIIVPDDPLYSQQYGIITTQINQVWDTITGDSTQVIAILDTGVDWLHPDLSENIWNNNDEIAGNGIDDDNNGKIDDIRGWDFINNDNNPMDNNSHGTHVAGIAAARGNNGIGIAGVNWYAKIIPIKVFPGSGSSNAATISSGIVYASDNGATVLNMSFGGYGRSFTMENALQNAYLTADLVASAGNNSNSIYSIDPFNPTTFYPSALSYVLGVEASAGFSNYDPDGPILSTFPENFNYELTAPGSGIISTALNGTYKSMSGTSMSAPLVSGAVSLYRAHFPNVSDEKLWGDFIHTSMSYIQVYDAFNPTNMHPVFDLSDYTIEDTLSGNDQDGQADAGELIQIYTTIRNTWGYADSVYALLSHSIYSDTSDLNLVHDSVFFGSLSTYGSLSNLSEPFLIRIDSNCFNNRNITMNVTMRNAGDAVSYTQEIDFVIYNGEELSGILTSDTTLTPDKLWLINNSVRVSTGVTLTILPGTHLEINAQIDNRGTINAAGTLDSIIVIKGTLNGNGIFKYIDFDLNEGSMSVNSNIERCNIINGGRIEANKISYSTLRNCGIIWVNYFSFGNTDSIVSTSVYNSCSDELGGGFFDQCLFDNIVCGLGSGVYTNCVFNDFTNIYVYLYPNSPNLWSPNFLIQSNYDLHHKNSFLNNNQEFIFVKTSGSDNYQDFSNHYWGTTDSAKITSKYYDFWDDATIPKLVVNPILTMPSDSCPGHVWKVLVNGKDAQDEIVDPVGVGLQKFEVFFNRVMDTTTTPMLSFGVRSPFLQNIVDNSDSWSIDKKSWTAYYNVDLFTGDGEQTIRVADAQDSIGNEIIVEDKRFTFIIQAAGVQSVNFIATAGIGKVELEWNSTGLLDFLGFNMYRYMNITDTTFSNPIVINTSLIIDTIYNDFNIIPDSTYHYYYKIVDTDLQESDSSNIVTATPFDAANGDANGDLAVNVLDITTIVSYMLNQSPNPFLFDAADVNYDDEINVLDIIGLVQLINGKKSSTTQPLPEISNERAYYYFDDNKVGFESKGNVAALQFRLKVKSKKLMVKSNLDDLKIFSIAKGFEFAYCVVGDEIIGILYSLSGREMPEGLTDLFRFEGIDINDIEITEIYGGDLRGNYILVLKKGTNSVVFATDAELQVSPNPFSYSTQINYTVQESGIAEINLFDLNGTEIGKLQNSFQNAGKHSLNWNGTNDKGQLLKSGIYLLQLKVKSISGNYYNKEIKVVLTK